MPQQDAPPIYRTFTIKYDMANDKVDYDNPDDLTYLEILGMIKFCEMGLAVDMMKQDD